MTEYVSGRTIEKFKLAEHLSMKRTMALYVRLIKEMSIYGKNLTSKKPDNLEWATNIINPRP